MNWKCAGNELGIDWLCVCYLCAMCVLSVMVSCRVDARPRYARPFPRATAHSHPQPPTATRNPPCCLPTVGNSHPQPPTATHEPHTATLAMRGVRLVVLAVRRYASPSLSLAQSLPQPPCGFSPASRPPARLPSPHKASLRLSPSLLPPCCLPAVGNTNPARHTRNQPAPSSLRRTELPDSPRILPQPPTILTQSLPRLLAQPPCLPRPRPRPKGRQCGCSAFPLALALAFSTLRRTEQPCDAQSNPTSPAKAAKRPIASLRYRCWPLGRLDTHPTHAGWVLLAFGSSNYLYAPSQF